MSAEVEGACTFCRVARGELTPEVVAFRNGQTAVFSSLHQQPRNPGHMLVVPTQHVSQIYELPGELAGPLMTTLARVAAGVKTTCRAAGVSIRQNNDEHGDQDVFHVHFHVIPRFAGDGFNAGADRFPFGAVEIPVEERIRQAAALSEVLNARMRS